MPLWYAEAPLLRLRALIGMSARCEILSLLGSEAEVHPAAVARLTGYHVRTVQEALSNMACSGHVRFRASGREKQYSLDHTVLEKLLTHEGNYGRWVAWPAVYAALEELLGSVRELSQMAGDAEILAAELCRRMVPHSNRLGEVGFPHYFAAKGDKSGFPATAVDDARRLLGEMS